MSRAGSPPRRRSDKPGETSASVSCFLPICLSRFSDSTDSFSVAVTWGRFQARRPDDREHGRHLRRGLHPAGVGAVERRAADAARSPRGAHPRVPLLLREPRPFALGGAEGAFRRGRAGDRNRAGDRRAAVAAAEAGSCAAWPDVGRAGARRGQCRAAVPARRLRRGGDVDRAHCSAGERHGVVAGASCTRASCSRRTGPR